MEAIPSPQERSDERETPNGVEASGERGVTSIDLQEIIDRDIQERSAGVSDDSTRELIANGVRSDYERKIRQFERGWRGVQNANSR